MTTSLVPADTQYADANLAIDRGLCGSVVSSLHKLKDTDSKGASFHRALGAIENLTSGPLDGGFFVFGDVSVKKLGEHRLLFSLFELHKCVHSSTRFEDGEKPVLISGRTTGEVLWHKSILSDIFTGTCKRSERYRAR